MINTLKKTGKLAATVHGVNSEGVKFTQALVFKLIPPNDDNHYGSGCYMNVEFVSSTKSTQSDYDYVDVRYAKTTDVQTLAERWIENYYGDSAKSVLLTVVYE